MIKTLFVGRAFRPTMVVELVANMCSSLSVLVIVEHIHDRNDRMVRGHEYTDGSDRMYGHDSNDDIPLYNDRFFSMQAVEYVSAYGWPHLPQP